MRIWKEYHLGQIADFSYGKMPKKDLLNKGIFPTFSGYKYQHKYPENNCEIGDLIVVARGVGGTGDVKLVKEKCYLTNLSIKISLNQEFAINKFIYYNFLPVSLRHLDSGSAQSQITINDLKNVKISIPPLPTQKAIAETLSSLDDKIELNNQINQNLEALAQAIFKQWFVDFEFPNENGEPYKSSGGEIVDSELGEIPKGWDVLELGIVSDLLAGGDKPKNYSLIQTDELKTPIYSNGISQEGLYGFTDIPKVIEESVTVSARGTIGFVCLRTQPYVPIVRLISAIPKEGFITNKYLYLWLKNQKIYGNGTTQQQLTIPDFKKSKILVPNYDILLKITQVWNSFFKSIFKIREENKHLINLRDTLLPKLISGELEINDVNLN
jgi:type I restriction enzyme S subunit